MLVLVII